MDKIENAKNELLRDETKEKVSELFKTLADPTRIRILFALKKGMLTVTELTLVLDMSQSAISHQLKRLKTNNLVKVTRHGKEMYYELSDDHVYRIFNQAILHVEEDL